MLAGVWGLSRGTLSMGDSGLRPAWCLGSQSELLRKRKAGGNWIFSTTWSWKSHHTSSIAFYWSGHSAALLRFQGRMPLWEEHQSQPSSLYRRVWGTEDMYVWLPPENAICHTVIAC
jgi:hypothetical protein